MNKPEQVEGRRMAINRDGGIISEPWLRFFREVRRLAAWLDAQEAAKEKAVTDEAR